MSLWFWCCGGVKWTLNQAQWPRGHQRLRKPRPRWRAHSQPSLVAFDFFALIRAQLCCSLCLLVAVGLISSQSGFKCVVLVRRCPYNLTHGRSLGCNVDQSTWYADVYHDHHMYIISSAQVAMCRPERLFQGGDITALALAMNQETDHG